MMYRNFLFSACAAAALAASAAQGGVIAGWYQWANSDADVGGTPAPPEETDFSVTATMIGGDGGRGAWQSTDGTYGPTEPTNEAAPGTANGAFAIRINDPTITFSLTNDGSDPLRLDEFAFDWATLQGSSLSSTDQLSLFYDSGDLGVADGTFIGEVFDAPILSSPFVSDYADESISLAVLADQTLGAGETALFRLVAGTGGSIDDGADPAPSAGTPAAVDNIAFLGEAVPEPGSLALLALGAVGLIRRCKVSC